MRTLTNAEARVIAILLASGVVSERERLRRTALPRSTFHAARRRVYEESWVGDRYIPEPELFGWPFASFVLARPFADRYPELISRLGQIRGTVVLWGSARLVFAVSFHPDRAGAESVARGVGGQASWSFSVVTDLTSPSVPVYFDYEGLFVHLAGLSGTIEYPRGIGGYSPAGDSDGRATDHQAWAAGELVHRPFLSKPVGRDSHLVGPLGLPFSQQRLVGRGWVRHRVLLHPESLPPYADHSADQVVLIGGSLRQGRKPEPLFQGLTRDSQVYPFLFVHGDGHVLIGALGRSSAGLPQSPSGIPRKPVIATLSELLEGIEISQESASSLTAHVDHRYDRLLPRHQ